MVGVDWGKVAFGGYSGYGCGGSVAGRPDAEVTQPDLPPPDTATDKVEPADTPFFELSDLFPDIEVVIIPDVPDLPDHPDVPDPLDSLDTPDPLDSSEVPDLPKEIAPEVPDIANEAETETPCQPEPEKCNGLDDNCNGETDEGLTETTYSGFPPESQNIAPCRPQIMVCKGGLMIINQFEITPKPEIICNGIDEDCDGVDALGNPPGPFDLSSPENESTGVSYLTPVFSWGESIDPESAVSYNLLISQEQTFANPIVKPDLAANQYSFGTGEQLQCGTNYYWKAEAVDQCGNPTPSNSVFSFSTSPTVAWTATYTGIWPPFEDAGTAVKVGSDDGIFIAGTVGMFYSGQGYNILLVKYDTNGQQLWEKQFNNGYYDRGFDLALDGAENIYVAGRIDLGKPDEPENISFDAWVGKYDPNGELKWSRTYDGGINNDDGAYAIAVDNNGEYVYATGDSYGADNHYHLWLRKYETVAGGAMWTKVFDNPSGGGG